MMANTPPTYQRQHPVHGTAGVEYVFRFPNGHGFTAGRRFSTEMGWTVTEVMFIEREVTSFVPSGDPVKTNPNGGPISDNDLEAFVADAQKKPAIPQPWFDPPVGSAPPAAVAPAQPAPATTVSDASLSPADKQVVQDEADAQTRFDATQTTTPASSS